MFSVHPCYSTAPTGGEAGVKLLPKQMKKVARSVCLSGVRNDGCGSIKWMKAMLPPFFSAGIAPHLHGSIGDTEGVIFPTSQFTEVHSALQTPEEVWGGLIESIYTKSTCLTEALRSHHKVTEHVPPYRCMPSELSQEKASPQ